MLHGMAKKKKKKQKNKKQNTQCFDTVYYINVKPSLYLHYWGK